MKKNLGFAPVRSFGPTGHADFALASSMKHNRSLKNMEKLNQSIDWNRINTILLSHYTVGTSSEGADVYPVEFEKYSTGAYPPLLLFKCLLLQKWFRPRGIGFAFHGAGIDSDPELENQIYPVK